MAGNKMAAGSKEMAAPAPQPIVVPAGTVITVRLGETLSSKESQAGQAFTAPGRRTPLSQSDNF